MRALRTLAATRRRGTHANTLIEFLWCLLPDKCQRKDCARMGVRGNENIIYGEIVCDYCHCADGRKNIAAP